MREGVRLLPKKGMDFLGCHCAPKPFRTVDAGSEDHCLRLSHDDLDRLDRSRRLLRHNSTKNRHFLAGAHNSLFAPVPNGKAGRSDDNEKQTNPGNRQMPAGTKMSTLRAIGFYHAATLAKDA